MPASVMTPKYRIANTNIAATDAVCCRPVRMNWSGPQAEAAGQRRGRGHDDERDQRRHAPAHDQHEQHERR